MLSFESLAKQFEDSKVLEQLGGSVGANPEQVEKAAALSLPTLMEALNRNSNDKEGAESLAKALDSHKGADVDDVVGFLKNVDTKDGEKIVGHVLGDKNDKVTKNLAKKTGLDVGQVAGLLTQFAPLILSFMGNKKEEEELDAGGVSGLTSMLSGLFGGGNSASAGSNNDSSAGGLLGMASGLLDGKDDDDDDDDGGGLLGMLGGLLG